jgi:hypothetical protein
MTAATMLERLLEKKTAATIFPIYNQLYRWADTRME